MNDIMVDLETLDNTSTAVILSIGAVRMDFDKFALGAEFYQIVDPVGQGPLTIGADTVRWWLQQSPEAQSIFRAPAEKVNSLKATLASFSSWIIRTGFIQQEPVLWGNGATFDNMILRSAYAAMGQVYPVRYWNDRCYRTMKSLFPLERELRVGTKHNALDDARYQAENLIRIMKKLKGL